MPIDFVTNAGASIPVEVRRRKGARHLRLSLGHQNQIVASVPWRTSDRSVSRFLEHQKDWLESQLTKAPPVMTLSDWLTQNPEVSASGDLFVVRLEQGQVGRAAYRFEEGGSVLVLNLPDSSELTLCSLMRRFAQDALACRVAYHAKRLGVSYSRLSVRDQSSRWGSCSSSKGLSLNWRLVLLRPALQDYVILHELAHLTEMNHGQGFWALLDQYDPLRKIHEAELDALSPGLMRVGRFSRASTH